MTITTVSSALVIALAVALALTVIIFETVIYKDRQELKQVILSTEVLLGVTKHTIQNLRAIIKEQKEDIEHLNTTIREYERELDQYQKQ